jgi:hypothetical protein
MNQVQQQTFWNKETGVRRETILCGCCGAYINAELKDNKILRVFGAPFVAQIGDLS